MDQSRVRSRTPRKDVNASSSSDYGINMVCFVHRPNTEFLQAQCRSGNAFMSATTKFIRSREKDAKGARSRSATPTRRAGQDRTLTQALS